MGIPKKIHYVWVGDAPIPKEDQKFIKHWQELNPDYEVKRWSEKDIDILKEVMAKERLQPLNVAGGAVCGPDGCSLP